MSALYNMLSNVEYNGAIQIAIPVKDSKSAHAGSNTKHIVLLGKSLFLILANLS